MHLSGEYTFASCCRSALDSIQSWDTGTIKHAQLAAIAHNREVIARYRARAMTPGECNSLLAKGATVLIGIGIIAAGYRDSYERYLETSTTEIELLQD